MKIGPLENETEEAFLARSKAELVTEFRNELPAAVVDVALKDIWNQRERIRNAGDEFPKKVSIRHLEPGLVHYEYLNDGKGATVLVTKPFMDRIRPTAIGKPVINRRHNDDASVAGYKKGENDGIIVGARYNPADGWDWFDCLVWDQATADNIENGYSASCQYAVTDWKPGGTYHNIPYEREALNGAYEHIAIVPRGRYEGVQILMNSKAEGGTTMKLKFWPFNKDKGEKAANAVEMDTEKATLEIDGKDVPLDAAVASYQEKLKNDAAKAAAEEAARNAAPPALTDQDMIMVNGKPVSVADLKAAHAAHVAVQLKNAEDSKMEKAHKDGDHDDKALDNCPMCNKAKNDAEEAAKKKLEDEEKEKAKNAAAALDKAANERREPVPFGVANSIEDRLQKGREMFGSAKAAA